MYEVSGIKTFKPKDKSLNDTMMWIVPDRADVNVCDQFFWTPLHHAAHAGQVELVELMVEAGAVIDARALSGGTPLMRAIESSRPSCVDFLIKAGASVNAENKKGLTLHLKYIKVHLKNTAAEISFVWSMKCQLSDILYIVYVISPRELSQSDQ